MSLKRKLLLHELPAGLLFKMRANSLTPKYFLRAIKGYLLLSLLAGMRAIACISFRATLCPRLRLTFELIHKEMTTFDTSLRATSLKETNLGQFLLSVIPVLPSGIEGYFLYNALTRVFKISPVYTIMLFLR